VSKVELRPPQTAFFPRQTFQYKLRAQLLNFLHSLEPQCHARAKKRHITTLQFFCNCQSAANKKDNQFFYFFLGFKPKAAAPTA
jgi:CRISPR/Cas system endoribonuclease Cas6 (RAMP superfamily)